MTDDHIHQDGEIVHEDHLHGGLDDHADFDDFDRAGGGTLGDLWRSNPLVKVGAVAGGVILIVALLVLFGGHRNQPVVSNVSRGSEVKSTPGEDVTPAYANAVKQTNAEAAQQAERSGESAIGVPIGAAKEPVAVPDETASADDPLSRWRRIQEERTKRDVEKKPDLPQVDPNADAIKNLAAAMAKQMESVLKNLAPGKTQYKLVESNDAFDKDIDAKAKAAADAAAKTATATAASATTGQSAVNEKTVDIIVPAGTIVYAQLITQANTDAPGPVLAQIASGPLSGSRILGSFKALDNYLVLSFDTVVINGVGFTTSAVALDPSTANPGMVSNIDHRYFKRVILPAAASFIEGLGSAVADSGNTNVSVEGSTVVSSTTKLDTKQQLFKGVEQGASKFGDILDQDAQNTKPLITVDAGTPMGILFTTPVTKDKVSQN